MRFRDREEAGERLAAALRERAFEGCPVVLGIARGGMVVAARVARALGADLGVVVAGKISAPGQPDLALGAVTADGVAQVNRALTASAEIDEFWLRAEMKRLVEEARRRVERFALCRALPRLEARRAIVVDDGVVTGATAIAALRSVRRANPARLILAVPVGLPRSLRVLRRAADEVICLDEDPQLFSVAQAYAEYRAIGDAEVEEILSEPC